MKTVATSLRCTTSKDRTCVSTRLKRRVALAKDLMLFGIGLGGISWQIIINGNNIVLLSVCLILVGVGSLTGLTSIARGTAGESMQRSSTLDSSASSLDSAP